MFKNDEVAEKPSQQKLPTWVSSSPASCEAGPELKQTREGAVKG